MMHSNVTNSALQSCMSHFAYQVALQRQPELFDLLGVCKLEEVLTQSCTVKASTTFPIHSKYKVFKQKQS